MTLLRNNEVSGLDLLTRLGLKPSLMPSTTDVPDGKQLVTFRPGRCDCVNLMFVCLIDLSLKFEALTSISVEVT